MKIICYLLALIVATCSFAGCGSTSPSSAKLGTADRLAKEIEDSLWKADANHPDRVADDKIVIHNVYELDGGGIPRDRADTDGKTWTFHDVNLQL